VQLVPWVPVVFIADASTVGDDIKAPLTQGYGGLIWASAAEQAKHPCIVLVPTYKKVVIDDHTGFYVAEQVETTKELIEDVATRYGVDKNRIYGTGQSMGCMITMYLAAKHPDLYAAELLVSGQWDVNDLAPLATQKFFYVAAAGDPKASKGQIDLLPVLLKQGVQVSTAQWNAKDSVAELDAAANKEIAQNHKINFATFTAGSVLPAKASKEASEHMYSFDHVYKIAALRDWLFNQHK
jgi:predicted peptidase